MQDFQSSLDEFVSAHARKKLRQFGIEPSVYHSKDLTTYNKFKIVLTEASRRQRDWISEQRKTEDALVPAPSRPTKLEILVFTIVFLAGTTALLVYFWPELWERISEILL